MIEQLSTLLGSNISYALGWTIIHSLWQVSLLALMMSVIHRIYQDRSAELRYNVSLGTMVISLLVSIITFLLYYTNNNIAIADGGLIPISDSIGLIEVATEDSLLGVINAFVIDNIQHVNVIWTTGLILFLLRFIVSFGYVKYIKNTSTPLLDKYVNTKINQLRESLIIKKYTSVAESAKISVPMVLGHIKPIILFPIGMINMLSTTEIEAIIIHELTHIKRNDYAVNIAITLVETLYYYHPAMWWVSANVKAERENCCDDAAINHNIDPVTYAKALVKLEEIRKTGIPALAMPFASNKHQLLNRIKRILNMEQTKNDIKEKSVATVLLLSVAMIFASNTISPQPEMIQQTEDIEIENISDSLKLVGNDEIIVEVNKGLFSSLTVDGEEVKEGEMIDQLKRAFSGENIDESNDRIQKYHMKGNPSMGYDDMGRFMFWADSASFDTNEDISAQKIDTLPTKMHLDRDHVTIMTNKNKKKIEVQKEDGEVIGLKIDGREIPKSEFDQHQELIDHALENFVFDFDGEEFRSFNFGEGNMDSIFSRSFGMIYDGENMRRFGGNMSELLEGLEGLEGIERLEDLEGMERLKSLKGLKGLKSLEGLQKLEGLHELHNLEGLHELHNLRGFEGLHELHNLEGLGDYLDKMGIQLDSTMKIYNFDNFNGFDGFDRFDGFDGFDGFDFFDDDNMEIRSFGGAESGTVVDKLGSALNKDGLLEEYKSNKIELSGKHLKINGDKMPKALFNKYKDIYQQETGAALTKKSKMIFDVEGKPSKRRIKSF